jgi:hypothetical protein
MVLPVAQLEENADAVVDRIQLELRPSLRLDLDMAETALQGGVQPLTQGSAKQARNEAVERLLRPNERRSVLRLEPPDVHGVDPKGPPSPDDETGTLNPPQRRGHRIGVKPEEVPRWPGAGQFEPGSGSGRVGFRVFLARSRVNAEGRTPSRRGRSSLTRGC